VAGGEQQRHRHAADRCDRDADERKARHHATDELLVGGLHGPARLRAPESPAKFSIA